MNFRTSSIIVFLLGIVYTLQGQVHVLSDHDIIRIAETDKGTYDLITLKSGKNHLKYTAEQTQQKQLVTTQRPGNRSYIVEFTEKPEVAVRSGSGTKTRISSPQKSMERLQRDLGQLSRKARTTSSPRISRSFHKIFSGVEIEEMSEDMARQLQSLPYIKRVSENFPVKAFLDQSVEVIRADAVWSILGSKGAGISVGIIDTGIDYNHPALGGGYGPSFKVKGGYDFVNNDADPFDDHGHGTHCAGIVAGNNETIQGVAPEADLYALKVLSAEGSGTAADIIAAIEWASDPNNDGDYSDHLDVISMSLGGTGHPDDPLSVAVDNATLIGLIACVAAGNESKYNKIASPGTARTAITVGASNNTGNIASFSSKGPNKTTMSIKPEVVAPGVDIYSSIPEGGYDPKSGTSMATPHVAGVAALLKQLHPEWTPDQVKSALMTTADNLSKNIMAQGAGQVNAYKAAINSMYVSPAHLSFGLLTENSTITDTLMIRNKDSLSRSYSIAIDSLPAGVTLTATPANFSIDAGDSLQVVVDLGLTVDDLPAPDESHAYGGYLHLHGNIDTLHMPWAFVNRELLTLTFDVPYPNIIISGSQAAYFDSDGIYTNDGYQLEIPVPADTFDVIFTYYQAQNRTTIIREKVAPETDSLTISTAEAQYTLDLQTLNEYGDTLTASKYIHCLLYPSETALSFTLTFTLGGTYTGIYKYSGFSSRYTLRSAGNFSDAFGSGKIYHLELPPLNGLNSDTLLINDPGKMITQTISLKRKQDTTYQLKSVKGFVHGGSSVGIFETEGQLTGQSWEGQLFMTARESSNKGIGLKLGLFDNDELIPNVYTGYLFGEDQSIYSTTALPPSTNIYHSPSGKSMHFGEGIIYPKTELTLSWFMKFYGQYNEELTCDNFYADFKLFDGSDNLLDSGKLTDLTGTDIVQGINKLEVVNTNYSIGNVQGKGTYTSQFEQGGSDSVVPRITSLQIRNKYGVPADTFELGDPVSVLFSFYEATRQHVYVKSHDTEEWKTLVYEELPVVGGSSHPIGKLFEAAFSDFDGTGLVDLKIAASDVAGNQMTWELAPAFVLIDQLAPELVISPTNSASEVANGTLLNFGQVVPGSTSSPFSFIVTNTGPDPLFFHNSPAVTTLSGDTTYFKVTSDFTSDTLFTGDSVMFSVSLKVDYPGTFADTLIIANSDSDESYFYFPLYGESTSPQMKMRISWNHLDHNATEAIQLNAGYSSGSYVYIDNLGNYDLILDGNPKIQLSGPDAASFSVNTTNTASTVAPGSNTYFKLLFNGTSLGTKELTMTIPNNDPGQAPYTTTIVADMISADIDVRYLGSSLVNDSSVIDFGSIVPGQSSDLFTFMIKNNGDAPLGFYNTSKISVNNGNPTDFTVDFSQIPYDLNPGDSTFFTVKFSPSEGGLRTTTIRVNCSYDYDEPNFEFTATGMGLAPEMHMKVYALNLPNGGTYNFPAYPTGLTYTRRFTIENTGGEDLIFTGSPKILISGPAGSDYVADTTSIPDTLSAGSFVYFNVLFTPSAAGTRTAQLTIYNNDSNENPYSVTLNGTGTSSGSRTISVSPTSESTDAGIIRIYPNPSSSSFNILADREASVTIYDLSGRLIDSFSTSKDETYTYGENLPPGVYLVKFISQGHVKVMEIIKN